MVKNVMLCGIVCLAICLLGAPCLAQAAGVTGPELRQWIENPEQGLAAMREGRLADLPQAPEGKAKAAAPTPVAVPAISDKAVPVTLVDAGIEATVREQLNRPTGPIYDEELLAFNGLDAEGRGVQSVEDLQYMPNLQFLSLENNRITSLAGFPYMWRLHVLILDLNQLGSLEGLPSMPAFNLLYARRNQISTLAGMPELPVLTELYLDNNQIASLADMPKFINLNRLSLSQNRIQEVAGLTEATYLSTLDLSHNSLKSLSKMPLYGWLNTLDISFNQLSSAAGLYRETPVYQLYADHNQLTSLGIIGALDRVSLLSVGSNQLTSLDGTALNLDLRDLDLSHNRLVSLAGVENYPSLGRLNAAGNCLKSLGALGGLHSLYWLSLVGDGLTSLADFPAMPALQSLDVSCNQLTTLAEMGDTPLLSNLDARSNQLQTLDPGYRPALGFLGLSSNGLTSLATLNGANSPYLYIVDITFNQLSSLQGIEKLPSISAVAARGNQIGSLAALSQNARLNWLDISSNRIASFDDLPPNPPLSWLNASRNQITSLRGLAAAANLYLNRLDVSHNLLTSVAELGSVNKLYSAANLNMLDISDNQVSDITPLEGHNWQEIGLANNPTGDVQSVVFGYGGAKIVSVGPGQLPSLKPFSYYPSNIQVINATGPEYGDLSVLPWMHLKQLRVTGAEANIAGLAKAVKLYASTIGRLGLPNTGLSDIAALSEIRVGWLDLSENNVADLSPVTSGYMPNTINETAIGIVRLNASSNPVASLAPALGGDFNREYFPPIGAQVFSEYEYEQFGMSPEQAHACVTSDPEIDVTNTPVATAPEVAQLRAEGVRVRTDGTCSYCQGACVPPQQVAVPTLAGLTQEAASAALVTAGLVTGDVTRQCSDAVAAGFVINSDPPAGTLLDAGASVALVLSLGPCTVTVAVPNVVGQSGSDAVAAIQSAGLAVGALTQQHSNTVAAGSVISQNPAAGASVAPGTAVALVISLGPTPPAEGEVEGEGEGEVQTPLADRAQALISGFAAADSNGDGQLSLAEAQISQPGLTAAEFSQLDRNGDGSLSKRELDAYLDGGHGGGCHGASGWAKGLADLVVLILSLFGLGAIGNLIRS